MAGGGLVDPHSHPTHEFYYVTSGRGLMTIGDEEREIGQGDLVHIPPDAVHSLRPCQRPRADPLLLLRGGRDGRGRGRLHHALTGRPAGSPRVEAEQLDGGLARLEPAEEVRFPARTGDGPRPTTSSNRPAGMTTTPSACPTTVSLVARSRRRRHRPAHLARLILARPPAGRCGH